MTTRFTRNPTRFVAGLITSASLSVCHAQYALFDQNTDTIAISGETSLATSATFEAVVFLSDPAKGSVYREQGDANELKSLAVSATSLEGFAKWTSGDPGGFSAAASINLNVFHHIAFVHFNNGSTKQQRLYLDGVLIGSRSEISAQNDINDATSAVHPPAIGGSQVNTSNESVPGFVGLLDSVRVSNVARYLGSSFTAPTGDLSADANTLLLYNFNPTEVSRSTVVDLSWNGHTGTFGSGFSGATAPVIVPPGDFNHDGTVDAADYVVWRHGLGTIYTQNDYDVWRAHFGQMAGNGAALPSAEPLSAAVPEPASALLFIMGWGTTVGVRRGRRLASRVPSTRQRVKPVVNPPS